MFIPIPSFDDLKKAYDGVMKAIGFIKDTKAKYSETSYTKDEIILRKPSRGELVEKILNGTFARIPGVYKIEVDGKQREIEMAPLIHDMNVTWKFRDVGETEWWAMGETDIKSIKWIELVKVIYD